MLATLGLYLIYLSLIFSWITLILHWKGNSRFDNNYRNVKYLSYISSAFLWIAMLILITGFIIKDYTMQVVFQNTDNSMNLFDSIMATWAARQGAMLLWGLIQSTITIQVLSYFDKPYKDRLQYRATAIILFFNALIIMFAVSTRPTAFATQASAENGLGLTPSLLNFWQQIHPPIAFLSYSAFIVPYSIGLAYLTKKEGEVIPDKLKWLVDFYMLLAWVFSTYFIIAGSIWAYEVDWGGFWIFDPVQVSSILLWIFGSVYFHTKQLQTKHSPLQMFAAALGWVGVTFTAFVVRGGLLEGPHQYSGTAQLIVFTLLLIGTVTGLIISIRKSYGKILPDWIFSVKITRKNYNLQTFWILSLIILFNLTSIILQIFYSQMEIPLADLTSYYRIGNGILLTILSLLMILCERETVNLSNRIYYILSAASIILVLSWVIFDLPSFSFIPVLILTLFFGFTVIQFAHLVSTIISKHDTKKIGMRLLHFIIVFTLFTYMATDPQTIEQTQKIYLNQQVDFDDLGIKLTLIDVSNGSLAEVIINIRDENNASLGNVKLLQGIYLGEPWNKGDWIITPLHDIFIKLKSINNLLYFTDIEIVDITAKIVPGVNFFRINTYILPFIGLFSLFIRWQTKPEFDSN